MSFELKIFISIFIVLVDRENQSKRSEHRYGLDKNWLIEDLTPDRISSSQTNDQNAAGRRSRNIHVPESRKRFSFGSKRRKKICFSHKL